MNKPYQKVVCQGTWLYDNHVEKPVYVIEQNYDFWYELAKADGDLEEGEKPGLNRNGLMFYVIFDELPQEKPYWVRSVGFSSISEAKNWAASQLPSEVEWQ